MFQTLNCSGPFFLALLLGVAQGVFAQEPEKATMPAEATEQPAAQGKPQLVIKVAGVKGAQADAVRDSLDKGDTDAIKRAYDDLQNKFQEISADLYKQASASAGGPAGPGPGPQPGPQGGERPGAEQSGPADRGSDVVDAEFEVVDEDKKK